mgnify:CR=1 FL=1
MSLNTTDAGIATADEKPPTSKLFFVNGNGNAANTQIAYLWHDVPGLQKFGVYEGDGQTDGPYIHLGFKPAFVYYKKFGVIANISLIANLFIIVSLLGTIGATLTLPGIAGIVLTIGMAVDANVLIFERIKEESFKNKKIYETIKKGFDRALSTILDANITTLIASLLLFVFGSGPIKGFSITLSLGVIASMFTALMLTNLLVHFYVSFTSKKEINL